MSSPDLPNPEAFSPAEASEFQSILSRLAALESKVALMQIPANPPTSSSSDTSQFVTLQQLASFGIRP